jgi:hypothetical protein
MLQSWGLRPRLYAVARFAGSEHGASEHGASDDSPWSAGDLICGQIETFDALILRRH